jgi:hypothetical protein
VILQALLSIAIATVIAGAILTSALVNANVAAHQAATRLATAALSRGTDEFVNWAQRYVAKHGSATTWPTTPIVDQPVAACETSVSTMPCETYVTNEYQIRGSEAGSTKGPDPATNLQSALTEQRISAIITSDIAKNANLVASASQLVTVRIFNSAPFAILTGIRDKHADSGPELADEGDSGGYRDPGALSHRSTPNPQQPMNVQDTTISVTMSCTNSKQNSDMANPGADDFPPGNDGLPWGATGGRGYESPCTPEYTFATTPSRPADAAISTGNVYAVGSLTNSSWNSKGFSQSIMSHR